MVLNSPAQGSLPLDFSGQLFCAVLPMLEECRAFLPAHLQTSSCASFKGFPFTRSLLLRGSGARWWLSSLLPCDDSELVAFGLCTTGLWFVISCCEVVRGALVRRGEMLETLLS